MNVLSLFDGISLGKLALELNNIKITNYYAVETDKYAVKVSKHNHKSITHLGDIMLWRNWIDDLEPIDLIMAGFPCQAWSVIGKHLGFDDPRGKLVWVMMDIYNYIKAKNPMVKFLFENVRMKSETLNELDELFECNHFQINSKDVSAQNRVRCYWCNWKVESIENFNDVQLEDILEPGYKQCFLKNHDKWVLRKHKSTCLDANYFKGVDNHGQRTMVKCEDGTYRKLLPIECERLQTIPENYTLCPQISNTQRYKMIGNAWTVLVIAHILKQGGYYNKL